MIKISNTLFSKIHIVYCLERRVLRGLVTDLLSKGFEFSNFFTYLLVIQLKIN